MAQRKRYRPRCWKCGMSTGGTFIGNGFGGPPDSVARISGKCRSNVIYYDPQTRRYVYGEHCTMWEEID